MTTQKFDELATKDVVTKTEKALVEHNFIPESVEKGRDALARIKELIPAGASVMNGASKTLEQIGYVDYLKEGKHGWNNLHAAVLAETDKQKQALLRKQSVVSDWYLGSAHAITQDGQIVVSSASGSQLPHLAFTSPNIILVVSTEKIVPNLQDAFDRIKTYVVPLEDARMKAALGYGTALNKTLILHGEHPAMGRKVHIIFVNEKLGF
jgi:L-lactate utilization protein LutC